MTDAASKRQARIKFETTLAVAGACSFGLVALYFVLPLEVANGGAVWWRALIAALIFLGALAFEIRAVVRHVEPMRRAVVSLAVLIPLFIVLFASIYVTMSTADPATFGHRLSRVEALYLTVTILSTVGFGDITPKTDAGRIIVMAQMVTGVAILAVGVRLLLFFGSQASKRRS